MAVPLSSQKEVTQLLGAWSSGDQRALFLWPFKADEIAAALRRIA